MEWPEDAEPLVDFPENLIDADKPNIKIPNEFTVEIEEFEKVLSEDFGNLRKGVISGPLNTGSPCSLDLLKLLLQIIDFLYWVHLLDVIDGDFLPFVTAIMLHKTQIELERLLQHPELLPDVARLWFPRTMKQKLHDLSRFLAEESAIEEGKRLEHLENIKDYQKRMLPAFDDARTLWQQFFHGFAPGSGIPEDQMLPQGCTQLIPAACLLGAANRSDEHQDCARALEAAREKLLPPREVIHQPTADRPAPTEPASAEDIASLAALALMYPELSRKQTRQAVRPMVYHAALTNDRPRRQEE
ncbi:MAG: hypothetical protein Q9170_001903 [Blastenia crenularia]